ncbi:MAG: hypothetical protein H6765_04775 [Candidatus Peribacteria bacterium]|nr:MAG: hypothetical protein H6765_04775 [Candidatus Peribacteria bacterium]
MMKTLTLLLGFALLTYVVWLLSIGAQVTNDTGAINIVLLVACLVIALYLVAINFFPTWIPHNRWSLGMIGIGIMLLAEALLVDNIDQQVYLQDVMKVVAVFFIIAGPTKLLISKKMAAKKESENVEIIEV